MVVAWPPGGGADTPARLVAPRMQELLGQPIIIENRGGASGAIGAGVVAQAPADGYTLLADTSGIVTNSLTVQGLGYDSATAFTPVCKVVDSPLMLVVRPDDPAKDLQGLIARMRAEGGKLPYASSGNGAGTNLSTVVLMQRAGVSATHVVYRGGAQSVLGVLAGETVFTFSTLPQATPLVREGRLRALAVGTAQRLAALPDVPTVAEQGFPGFVWSEFLGFHLPAGSPAEAVQKLAAATADAVRQPEVQARLGQIGMLPAFEGPEAFAHLLAEHRSMIRDLLASGALARES
jgi:tripartite-type tricarboxylate transporter receptor subunit TctC